MKKKFRPPDPIERAHLEGFETGLSGGQETCPYLFGSKGLLEVVNREWHAGYRRGSAMRKVREKESADVSQK